MGAGMALRLRPIRILTILALLGALTGCSSENPGGANGLLGGVLGQIGAGGPTQAPPVFELTPDLVAQTGGAVIMVDVPALGLVTPMTLAARNGPVSTYSAEGVLTLSLRDGVIVATRGFGDDLMAARPASLRQLSGAEGPYGRSYTQFDGLNRTVETTATCEAGTAGSETLLHAGRKVQTRLVAETCIIPLGRVDNRYWLGASGRILRSKQWISPDIGFIEILSPG